jgi:hypothetical protein
MIGGGASALPPTTFLKGSDMQMNLSERYAVLQILPQKGDFIMLLAIDELAKSLAPTEKEVKDWGIVFHPDNSITWDASKAKEADISIRKHGMSIVCTALKGLNDKKELTANLITVYSKFLEKTEPAKEE